MKTLKQKTNENILIRFLPLIFIFIAITIIVLIFPVQNILRVDIDNCFAHPSLEHLLGTDYLGRDVYSLLITGGFRTIEVLVISTAISFSLGTFLGIIQGFYGGLLGNIIQAITDFGLIIPSFILAMVLSAIFGFSPIMAGVVFGIGNMGTYVNQANNLTLSLKKTDFINGEIVVGLSNFRIITRHILPNIITQLLVFTGNMAGAVVVQYAGLAFIGLGTDITNPDWGTMIYQYRSYLTTHPLLVICPVIAITFITFSLHFIFDPIKSEHKEVPTIYD